MKKRIHGLLYNTESAKKIADYEPEMAPSDNRWYKEALYKKKTGEYFLAGKGNGMSRYAEAGYDNNFMPGEGIVVLSLQEAKNWVELHQDSFDTDVWEQEFGRIKVSNKKVDKHVQISETANQKLARLVQQSGKTQNEIIESLIMNS